MPIVEVFTREELPEAVRASDIAKAGDTVLPVTLDVTDQVSVENAAARVAQEL